MRDVGELDGVSWRKSSYSDEETANCLELGSLRTGQQAVRDTKDHGRGALLFDSVTWQDFVNVVRHQAV